MTGCTPRGYGLGARTPWHHLADGEVVVLAAATALGAWQGPVAVVPLVAGLWLARRAAFTLVLCLLLGAGGGVLAERAWEHSRPRHVGPFAGWAEVVGDPAAYGSGLRVTLQVEGERFDAWLYGSARRRLEPAQSGNVVLVWGERTTTPESSRHRAALRHVVGQFQVSAIGDVLDGDALARAGNRVRAALRAAAESTMGADDAALFTGLVIGDDTRQSPGLLAAFRTSGLSHLTAVSGQNVAFLLAAAAPVLRRLRTWWRWGATLAVIGWFMAVTRFEPSVLRAGVMAMLAATAFALGRQAHPIRLLGWAVVLLVLLDPLLVWSVGFWLSVGATAGVCALAPWLAAHLPGPRWLTLPLGVTLGAQAGVALPSLLVFHRLPLVAVPANLAAVPVAGVVMLVGIPAALVAAAVPGAVASVAMAPAAFGTRWVATVAQVAAALETRHRPALLVGLALAVACWWAWRRRHVHVPS